VELLPNKKKLALNIFEELIGYWIKAEKNKDESDSNLLNIYKDFRDLFSNHFKIEGYSIDCYEFAQLLLDIIHPYFEKAEESRLKGRKRYNSLRDLKSWLKENPLKIDDLEFLWENIPTEEPLDKQVAAAIIAIPEDEI
jgi:hypothetical protein